MRITSTSVFPQQATITKFGRTEATGKDTVAFAGTASGAGNKSSRLRFVLPMLAALATTMTGLPATANTEGRIFPVASSEPFLRLIQQTPFTVPKAPARDPNASLTQRITAPEQDPLANKSPGRIAAGACQWDGQRPTITTPKLTLTADQIQRLLKGEIQSLDLAITNADFVSSINANQAAIAQYAKDSVVTVLNFNPKNGDSEAQAAPPPSVQLPGQPPRQGERKGFATGSGFRCDNQYVVTNAHVVGDKEWVTIVTQSGEHITGRVVGLSPPDQVDVALIKVEASEWAKLSTPVRTVSFATPDDLKVGMEIMAIGNPFGKFPGTVTQGVISQQGVDGERKAPFNQIDASINPGNSGGPFFVAIRDPDNPDEVRVVVGGINTAIFSPTGAWAGIGLADTPLDAGSVVTLLKSGISPMKVPMGVNIAVNPDLRTMQATVHQLTHDVRELDQFQQGLKEILDYMKQNNGQWPLHLRQQYGTVPMDQVEAKRKQVLEQALPFLKNRLEHAEQTLAYFQKNPPEPGVYVAGLAENGAAAAAGLQLGDQIVSLNGVPAQDPAKFANLVAERYAYNLGINPYKVGIIRAGEAMTVDVGNSISHTGQEGSVVGRLLQRLLGE